MKNMFWRSVLLICVWPLISSNKILSMLHQKLYLIDKTLSRKTYASHMHYRMHSKRDQHLFHLCCLFLQSTLCSHQFLMPNQLLAMSRSAQMTFSCVMSRIDMCMFRVGQLYYSYHLLDSL
ncbi:unnamed protein product [Prunus armeniaca]